MGDYNKTIEGFRQIKDLPYIIRPMYTMYGKQNSRGLYFGPKTIFIPPSFQK
jgi:hypothetical protein